MNIEKLRELAMWATWQKKVAAALPNFCADGIYVEQTSYLPEFEAGAEYVAARGPIDVGGKVRDAAFGALVQPTKALGSVTRMWLDVNVEIDFLRRHLPNLWALTVLDIGAGYGRLAIPMAPLVRRFYCVDAVPISTALCDYYCRWFDSKAVVLSLPRFVELGTGLRFDLAINVHSWNECSLETVAAWLEALRLMQVPWLFTVSHGQLDARIQRAYYTWGNGGPSFRPLLEAEFDLVAEESIGLGSHPHAIWSRKRR